MAVATLTTWATFAYVVGDTIRVQIAVVDEDEAPVNLTGVTPRAQITTHAGDIVASSEANPPTITLTITDAAGGLLEMTVPATVTASLPPRVYLWRVWLTDSQGRVQTPATGALVLLTAA